MFTPKDNYSINNPDRIFNAGIYVRLSREDDSAEESESITNQKDILSRYVISKGWNLIEIYIDDGYSGTNFNRPGFKRLVADIEAKMINLVISKDLSRLGRDYIDTGYFIEKYFPEKEVRYVALNDGIDTFENNSNNDMTPFRAVINDMYAKDISKKVRSVVSHKKAAGEFIGSFAPFGYMKDPENKNKLIIDGSAAQIVKRIFDMYVSGIGFIQIARTLTSEGIPSPRAYKKQRTNYKGRSGQIDVWSFETIKYILTNPSYIGNITQNRYTKVNYKLKKLKKLPREAWITVDDTHEPIIDEEIFQTAQQLLSVRDSSKYMSKGSSHLLSGMIYCGDCESRMTFLRNKGNKDNDRVYCVCSRYKRYSLCTRHSIPEKELEQKVINELQVISDFMNEQEKLNSVAVKKLVPCINNEIRSELDNIQKRLIEIKNTLRSLYEDKAKWIITEEEFIEFKSDFQKERHILEYRIHKLTEEEKKQQSNESETDRKIKIIKDTTNFSDVDKASLVKLIDRIIVHEGWKIDVFYKFIKPF